MVAHRGYVNLFGGLKNQPKLSIDSNLIHYKECFVMGSHGSLPRHHRMAVDLIARGAVRAKKYISAMFPLEKTAEAFAFHESRGGPEGHRGAARGEGGVVMSARIGAIAPSMMCADFLHLGRDLDALEAGGRGLPPRRHHGRPLRAELHPRPRFLQGARARSRRLPLDIHLMVENPERHVAVVRRDSRRRRLHPPRDLAPSPADPRAHQEPRRARRASPSTRPCPSPSVVEMLPSREPRLRHDGEPRLRGTEARARHAREDPRARGPRARRAAWTSRSRWTGT